MRLLLVLLLLLSPIPAFACRCTSPASADAAYAQAGAVFTAVIDITKGSRNGQVAGFHFTRGKSWKGAAPAEFTVPLDACAMEDVQSGAEYLVYATADLQVRLCSRRKLLRRARIEMQYLDALQAGNKPDLAAALPAALVAQDADMRIEAAELVGEVMRAARGATPAALAAALVQATRDRIAAVRLAAVRALGNTRGDAATGTLIAALQDTDREVRAAAVETFGLVLRGNSTLFRALVEALKLAHDDPNPDREKQESLLAAFARPLPGAAATDAEKDEAAGLLRGLIDEIREPWKRAVPVQHLGLMGPRARAAAPQLLRVLKGTDHYSLKYSTIVALGDVGAVDMQADIEPYLKDKDCSVAEGVVRAVWKMDRPAFGKFFAEKGMPVLMARFDEPPGCASTFISGLLAILPDGREMEPFLLAKHAAMDDSDYTRTHLKTLLDTWKKLP